MCARVVVCACVRVVCGLHVCTCVVYSRGVPMRNIASALNHQISASIRMGRKQLPAIDKSLYLL